MKRTRVTKNVPQLSLTICAGVALLICVLFGASPSAFAQYSPPTNGLVAWWPGDGNANDVVGGHNGTLGGGMGFTAGLFGQAFAGGGGRRVYIPDDPAFALTNFTMGVWVNVHADSWTIFVRQAEQDIAYALGGQLNGTIDFFIYSATQQDSLAAPISYNHWHQVTASQDSGLGQMSLYMDGTLVAQKATTVIPKLQLNQALVPGIGIGNDASTYDFPCLGDIEEAVLYSRALSAAEVALLAAGPCTPRQATATAQLVNGFVVGATLTDSGCGYTNTPAVVIEGGGGSGATATAVVSNSVVTGITITSAGVGYTSPPTIYIYSPLGLQISLVKAVRPYFVDLLLGTNYQLQVSGDMLTWTNLGAPFPATNSSMPFPQYFDVASWAKLFFRLQASP
jgi:hypothetical protein